MWSVGVIMYLLLTGKYPFAGDDKSQVKLSIINGKLDLGKDLKYRSKESRALLKKLLESNYKKRPYPLAALDHKWFKQAH